MLFSYSFLEERSPREEFGDEYDDSKKYIRSLEMLRAKFDRKLQSMSQIDSPDRLNKQFTMPSMLNLHQSSFTSKLIDKKELTLEIVLEEYLNQAQDTKSTSSSSGLYHFFDFLERFDPDNALIQARFWLAAEKYRYMIFNDYI